MPKVVLVSLFEHRDCDDKGKRHEPALGVNGRVGQEAGDDERHQEVEVCQAAKLLKQVDGHERQHRVLGRVGAVAREYDVDL